MTLRVVLINPDNNLDIIYNLPPLGGLYISSFLKSKGIDVIFYDFNIIKNWKKKFYEIIDMQPNFIGLTSNVSNFSNTLHLANLIKSFDNRINIIVGGPYPSCVPEKYLKNKNIDAVCIGEGEYTMYDYLFKGDKTDGLMVRKNNKLFKNKSRRYIINLDKLPFPDLTQVNLKKYDNAFQKKKPISNLITSRGCPYNCTFCFHGVHGFKWRARSPKNVVDEIKWQVNELGVKEICFWDDNLTMDLNRAKKIFEMIIREDLNVVFSTPNGIRADKLSKTLLSLMKKAGVWSITLAPETGDPTIIKRIQKGFNLNQVENAIKWCKELDLFLILYFMIGFPFEKLENVLNTLKFIKKVKPDNISIHRFYPFPHTPIAKEYEISDYPGYDYRTAKIPKMFEKIYLMTNLKFYSNPKKWVKIISIMGFKHFFYSYFLKNIRGIFLNKFKNFDYCV
ncbi:MAG: B12-binding domain-containing radical SAM protein [Candidatus Helarchaeota archaeon]